MTVKELRKVLEKVYLGVSKNEVMLRTSNFFFKDGWVYSFNGRMQVSHPLEVSFEGSLTASLLMNFIKNVPQDDELQIENRNDDGKDFLQLRVGRIKTKIVIDKELFYERITFESSLMEKKSEIKEEDEVETVAKKPVAKKPVAKKPVAKKPVAKKQTPTWIDLPKEFYSAMLQVEKCVSTELCRANLNVICIDKGKMMGTDGHKGMMWDIPEIEDDFMFHREFIPILKAGDFNQYCITYNHLWFKEEDGCFVCAAKIDLRFPSDDMRQLMTEKGIKIEMPNGWRDSIKRAISISERKERGIFLEFADDKLKISTDDHQIKFEEELPFDCSGLLEPIKFRVNPSYLLIEETSNDLIWQEGNSILFDDGKHKYLSMLMILDDK